MDYSKNQGIISHPTPVATSPAKPLFFYLLMVVGAKLYPKILKPKYQIKASNTWGGEVDEGDYYHHSPFCASGCWRFSICDLLPDVCCWPSIYFW
jgi:hypothetical protein